jgi:hypothetical protein
VKDPLQLFPQVILVSGIASVILGGVLLLLTVWRSRWRRILDAENAFWKRLGLSGNWTRVRRFEESRAVIYILAALLVLHLVLLAMAAGAWIYFAHRLHQPPPVSIVQPAATNGTGGLKDGT